MLPDLAYRVAITAGLLINVAQVAAVYDNVPAPIMLTTNVTTIAPSAVVGNRTLPLLYEKTNFTYAAFIRLSTSTTDGAVVFQVTYPGAPYNASYPVLVLDSTAVSESPHVLSISTSGARDLDLRCPIPVQPSAWYFIAFTVSGNTATCYEQAVDGAPGGNLLSNSTLFYPHIGSPHDVIYMGGLLGSHARGSISEFAYWPSALSSLSLASYRALFQTAFPKPRPTTRLRWWWWHAVKTREEVLDSVFDKGFGSP